MTPQKQFDKALYGIRKQKYQPSISHKSPHVCVYRGKNGLKCAVGHIIPDSVYTVSIEGTSVYDIASNIHKNCWKKNTKQFAVGKWLVDNCNVDILTDLQCAHDSTIGAYFGVKSRIEFENEMRMIAQKYNLTYREPNKNDRKYLQNV